MKTYLFIAIVVLGMCLGSSSTAERLGKKPGSTSAIISCVIIAPLCMGVIMGSFIEHQVHLSERSK